MKSALCRYWQCGRCVSSSLTERAKHTGSSRKFSRNLKTGNSPCLAVKRAVVTTIASSSATEQLTQQEQVPQKGDVLQLECQRFGSKGVVEFSFSNQVWTGDHADSEKQGFVLGLHRPGSHTEVMPVTTCKLQDETADGILQLVESMTRELGLQPYDPITNKGFLRHLVIRKGSNPSSGAPEFMVMLVTAPGPQASLRPISEALTQRFPSVVSVHQCVSKRRGPVTAHIDRTVLLAGQARISEQLGALRFNISPQSFFQTNTAQAKVLYEHVAAAAELQPDDTLLDLYCGTGTISLTLAGSCKAVHGFEVTEAAVEDARENAKSNGITNATFHTVDLESTAALQKLTKKLRPDVVVIDPARGGLERGVVDFLNKCGARRLVYVSCSPATQARDLARLCTEAGAGYRLTAVQPLDMFPHTDHVEAIAVLDKRN